MSFPTFPNRTTQSDNNCDCVEVNPNSMPAWSFFHLCSSGSRVAGLLSFSMLMLLLLRRSQTNGRLVAWKANNAPFTLEVKMLDLQVVNMSSDAQAIQQTSSPCMVCIQKGPAGTSYVDENSSVGDTLNHPADLGTYAETQRGNKHISFPLRTPSRLAVPTAQQFHHEGCICLCMSWHISLCKNHNGILWGTWALHHWQDGVTDHFLSIAANGFLLCPEQPQVCSVAGAGQARPPIFEVPTPAIWILDVDPCHA